MAKRYFTIEYEGDDQILVQWMQHALPELAAAHADSPTRFVIHRHITNGRDPSLPPDAHHDELVRAANKAILHHDKCQAGAPLDEMIEDLLSEIDELRKANAIHGESTVALEEALKLYEHAPPHVTHPKLKARFSLAKATSGMYRDMPARKWRRNVDAPPEDAVAVAERLMKRKNGS